MKNFKNVIFIDQDKEDTKAFKRNVNESYRKNYSKRDHREEFGNNIDYKRQKHGLQCKRGGGIRGTLREMRKQDDASIVEELGI